MPVALRPLAEAGLTEFIARSNAGYRQERIDAGDSPEYADERVAASNAQCHNTVARGLYDSLGYGVTATNMAKSL